MAPLSLWPMELKLFWYLALYRKAFAERWSGPSLKTYTKINSFKPPCNSARSKLLYSLFVDKERKVVSSKHSQDPRNDLKTGGSSIRSTSMYLTAHFLYHELPSHLQWAVGDPSGQAHMCNLSPRGLRYSQNHCPQGWEIQGQTPTEGLVLCRRRMMSSYDFGFSGKFAFSRGFSTPVHFRNFGINSRMLTCVGESTTSMGPRSISFFHFLLKIHPRVQEFRSAWRWKMSVVEWSFFGSREHVVGQSCVPQGWRTRWELRAPSPDGSVILKELGPCLWVSAAPSEIRLSYRLTNNAWLMGRVCSYTWDEVHT